MANLVRYRLRTDTAANWGAGDPVLLSGEPGFDSTANRLKWGDGVTAWSSLPYIGPQVVNDLTTGGADKVLSAEQGKQLKAAIDAKPSSTYTHPTGNGNNHLPAGGSSGQVLYASGSGAGYWGAAPSTSYTHPTGNGYNHLPSGGSSGQVLLASGSGNGYWGSAPASSNYESWTFTLSSGGTVTKNVVLR
ncbi:MAG: hypothetical protein IJR14_01945 [Synergistaceae bacterium]|nr:hypothetical protein [Synergistaceae bacterium]